MKKTLLLWPAMLCVCLSAAAQDVQRVERLDRLVRKKFFNISHVYDKIKPADSGLCIGDIVDETSGIADGKDTGPKNNWGVPVTRGRTYMFHRKPVARMSGFGLDLSFLYLAYSNYTGGRFRRSRLGRREVECICIYG